MLLGLQDVGPGVKKETGHGRDDARPVRAGNQQPPDIAFRAVCCWRRRRTRGVPPRRPVVGLHGYKCAASGALRVGDRLRDAVVDRDQLIGAGQLQDPGHGSLWRRQAEHAALLVEFPGGAQQHPQPG